MHQATLEEQFRNGDETALPRVYQRYAGAMYATAYNLLGNRDLAADAVQQAFIQAWRAAGSFDPARGLQPWLYAITRRAAIDTYRRQRRESIPRVFHRFPRADPAFPHCTRRPARSTAKASPATPIVTRRKRGSRPSSIWSKCSAWT